MTAKDKADGKLRPKQEAFCWAYLKTANATEAYRTAYKPKKMTDAAIQVEGHRMLKHPKVAQWLAAKQAQVAEKHGITVERVLSELAKIGFSDLRKAVKWGSRRVDPANDEDAAAALANGEALFSNSVELVPSEELDDDTAAAIAEISEGQHGIKIKLHDKKGALVDLGKHLGMFKDKDEKPASVVINFYPDDERI